MYTFAHDEALSIGVWVVDKPTPDEWAQHFEHLRQLARWSPANGRRAAIMLVPGSAFDRPDALRRAELARLTAAPGYDPFIALVTPNAAARGLLTVLRWMQPRPRWELEPFADTESALGWLEGRRGGALPALRAMTTEVLGRARRAGLKASIR
jgi:hypothetical protein